MINSNWMQMVFLVLMMAGLLGFSYILKRKINISGGDMKIKSVLHLGRKEKIIVAEIQGESLILGVTAHQINLIEKIERK